MTGKKNFIVSIAVNLLVGLLKGILKGHYDFERETIEEWNKEQRDRFARSFGESVKK